MGAPPHRYMRLNPFSRGYLPVFPVRFSIMVEGCQESDSWRRSYDAMS